MYLKVVILMWCKNCNKEIFSKKCDVCGSTALEHAPFDIYWCDHCKTPVIKQANAPDRAMCPLCGEKTRYLCSDLRPVFPEERLLIELLLGVPLKYINCSVWALNNRYYIDGKPKALPIKKFADADIPKLIADLERYRTKNNYDAFNRSLEIFKRANQDRLVDIKTEAIDFINETAKNYSESSIVISFSGGKDSTVVADLVVRALSNPSLVHIFGDTTLEFPLTYEYEKRFRKQNPKAIIKVAKNKEQDFYKVCEDIGPPARMMRWCCSMFKTGPITRVINNLFKDTQILTFYGIRKHESVSRSKYDRVGCWCCPNNNERAQFLSKIYMPDEYKKWHDFLVAFAKRIGKPDPENYVDSGNWKARQGGNGVEAAEDIKIKFTNCTAEENAKIYQLNKPVADSFYSLFNPFGIVSKELGRKMIEKLV